MTPPARVAAVAAFVLTIAGCVPMTADVFRPAAPGGRVVQTFCPPVDAVMLFERDTVRIAVDASPSATHTFVRVMLEVPEGKTVRFPDQPITVTTPAGASASAAPARYFRVVPNRGEFAPNVPMIGETTKFAWGRTTPYRQTDHAFYLLTVSIPIPGSDTFTVTIPRLRVNDADVELPPITFARTRQRYLGALNC